MDDGRFDEDRQSHPPRGFPELPLRHDGRPLRGYDRGCGYRHSHSSGYRSRSRSRDRNYERGAIPRKEPSREEELMREVVRRERDAISARGRSYSKRPTTFKISMASNGHGGPSNSGEKGKGSPRLEQAREVGTMDKIAPYDVSASPLKSVEESTAIEVKRKKLREKYG